MKRVFFNFIVLALLVLGIFWANNVYATGVSNRNIPNNRQKHTNQTTSKTIKITNPIARKYIGCFKDRGNPEGLEGRDLNGFIYSSNAMTPAMCINICAKKGFKYAGVQYSSYCFCGNSYGKYGRANNCNMKCSGNSHKICGGSWANNVYATGVGNRNIPNNRQKHTNQTTSKTIKITNCRVVGDNKKQGNVFLASTQRIYMYCDVYYMPKNTRITAYWYYFDTPQSKYIIMMRNKNTQKNVSNRRLRFFIEKPKSLLWPKGKYEIDLLINGRKTFEKTYFIQ